MQRRKRKLRRNYSFSRMGRDMVYAGAGLAVLGAGLKALH